ncbi:MAG: FecR domain-containing protein [Tannerellaceae bacterium]|jgi:ferric-dicitrate binding protein FerR (iron transport regulator)|nr:FecR domain-containing protein [Tannerellaceae bacterium]
MEVDDNILIQYIGNVLSEDEKAQVEAWLKTSSENKRILEQMYFVLQLTEKVRIMNAIDTDKAFALFKVKRKRKTGIGVSWRLSLRRIAIVLFIPLLVLTGYLILHNNSEDGLKMVEISAIPGAVSAFSLPDKSKVWLNANSSLTYADHFSTGKRLVELKGEGYFEVVKNATKPFVINAGPSYSIEVLGTSFNVSAYPDDKTIETTLTEGSVMIKAVAKDGNSITCRLKPNEKAEYQKDSKQLEIKQVDTDVDTGWMNGEIIFKQAPMDNVLNKLSRRYNVKFDVKDKVVMDAVITARFKDEQLSQVMEYLKVASGIKYIIHKPAGNGDNKSVISMIEIYK